MSRTCVFLCLWVSASAVATPISGTFGLATDANFVDIFGTNSNFVWQFHQGNAPTDYKVCPTLMCSVDGGNHPDLNLILSSFGFADAVNGAASANVGFVNGISNPVLDDGTVGGSISWHIGRIDWTALPPGESGINVPMEVTGLLTATDAFGHVFMNDVLTAEGTFHATGAITGNPVTPLVFLNVSGDFTGTVTPTPEPACIGLLGLGLVVILIRRR